MVEKKTEVKFGIVYALSNPSLVDPDDPKGKSILKIGFTERALEKRVETLSKSTSIPTPFEVEFDEIVEAPQQVERLIHAKLVDYRISSDKEFFLIERLEAMNVIENVIYGDKNPAYHRNQDGKLIINVDHLMTGWSIERHLRYAVDIRTKWLASGLAEDPITIEKNLSELRATLEELEAEPDPDKKLNLMKKRLKG